MPTRLPQFVRNFLKNIDFSGSGDYWSQRYAEGGDSGAGSYGHFAEFKAEVINRLVAKHGIETLVELGCGDGNQALLFDVDRYLGLDVAPGAIQRCAERFAGRTGFSCELYDPARFEPSAAGKHSDAALSLDVLYHLVEDEVYQLYLQQLFALAERLVIIYSSNKTSLPFLTHRHVRHRRFVDDVARLAPGWKLVETVPNRYPARFLGLLGGSFADFYIYARR
ncbi:MAG: class I SAM-dependent methyltransferase [Gammaproteobacteria bacterium]|nr:class I SAM-dependent methyltransferase [Gammaproteobacteria bacterium]